VALPLVARAQRQTKPVIGWLELFPGGTPPDAAEGFRRVLHSSAFQKAMM
jgi:hypothetical protein